MGILRIIPRRGSISYISAAEVFIDPLHESPPQPVNICFLGAYLSSFPVNIAESHSLGSKIHQYSLTGVRGGGGLFRYSPEMDFDIFSSKNAERTSKDRTSDLLTVSFQLYL